MSPQLAAHYADGGWLVRLAHGVYAFPNDEFGVYGALKFLQQRVPGLHVGGKSALALQGVRHNLGSRETLVLRGAVASRCRPGSPRAFRPATSLMDCVPPQGLARATAVLLHQREGRAPVPHLGAQDQCLVDVDALLAHPVRTGSNTRWMSRLDDGILRSLRPHG
ncbi:transcriptional regulator with AbiEi antitoxin N-terminal domain [Thauera chlorobenzoica]|uniref:Transcriptional regulator, AbiEi antitoxin n=1 Tax=Thauera chlorobenzoica TaxID=96773 RepID=A0A1H5YCQ6_9RHOO|nr:transcriptional regulator, AbiEi antitoxin [Thauera chlorobenzoica]SEG21552.1 transcriptional regulator with AbiEi antitoxin N-terminal domain [Thauera chlorobenzoica]